jgi:hypothetical protein
MVNALHQAHETEFRRTDIREIAQAKDSRGAEHRDDMSVITLHHRWKNQTYQLKEIPFRCLRLQSKRSLTQ